MSVIKITKCDNELILVASNTPGNSESYLVCDVKSGNNNLVDVTINLVKGDYNGPLKLDGVNGPISGTHEVAIPASSANLAILGVNWGGPTDLAVSVDGKPYTYKNNGNQALAKALGDQLEDNQGATLTGVKVALEPQL
ncbi:hypothetical protein MY04_4501 [Flammeovirga sp. MY04]|uniref:hypothetical protein n=1 Tax=Flammeovirga sp. MY04 TaxID=1191459 RepID=UPI00080631B1|nr:hypothetical protein [Flammeovirga sp. MY04]ANQ51836.1 hypothetical protein MY04_4501 [Flammeovirga sp. MY04]